MCHFILNRHITLLEKIMGHHSERLLCVSALSLCMLALAGCGNSHSTIDSAPAITVGNVVDDSVITAKVRTALLSQDDIKSLDIKVTVNKGRVMLSGFADNQVQIQRSVVVATTVEGVTGVENQLTVKEGQQTIGNKIDDSVITAGVKAALLNDEVVKSLDVSVTTRKGEVQLSGFVNNDAQATQAVAVAKTVDGVTSVANHMVVKQ